MGNHRSDDMCVQGVHVAAYTFAVQLQNNSSITGSSAPRTMIVEDLFLSALDVPTAERVAWLTAHADVSAAERAAAMAMVAAFEAGAGRVDAAMGAMRVELSDAMAHGDGSAGRYVLLHRLGSGGFGDVFLGRQEHPVRRLVAVKILRDALSSPVAHARFRVEQQAVASLDHPGIASMLETGELPDGRPWFAMPFVPGLPITDFAREHSLGLHSRVRMVTDACDAVEHAHRRGVIHRDLKPANVLVADDAGVVRPRVIDFGVAKLADAAFMGAGTSTVEGALVGTPEYMSPEQADAAPPDTRSDVFSLGTILYELLADRLPRSTDALRAGGRAGLAAAIRGTVPTAPSVFAPATRSVDSDLDAVCMQAIAADASARYQSVGELRADLQRWSDGETPLAVHPSQFDRALRFARRHWRGVAVAALVTLALLGSTAFSVRQANAAEVSRADAQRRADQNARVLEYMTGVLAGADPTAQGGREDVTVREQLALAVADLDKGALREAPGEAAEIRYAIGGAFTGIGRTDDAVLQYRAGMDALEASHTDMPALECKLAIQCSAGLAIANRGAEAVVMAQRALAVADRAQDGILRGRSLATLADAQRVDATDMAAAKQNAEEAVRLLRSIPEAPREELSSALNNLGIVYFILGEMDLGIAATEEAIEINHGLGKSNSYTAMFDLHNLSLIERGVGRLDDAERHEREALAIIEKLAGMKHPNRATVLGGLALIKRAKKEFAEGEQYAREGLQILNESDQGSSPDAAIAYMNLASLFRDQDKYADAVVAGRDAVRILDGVTSADPWLCAAARMSLGRALTVSKRYPEAEKPLQEAWVLLEPLGIDPKRRSSGLLALCQLYKAWNAADPVALPAEKLEACRERVRAFEAAHPGSIPANSY
jgi:non-specific serine/threonine protein kinase/serine/threonine-protein kinase